MLWSSAQDLAQSGSARGPTLIIQMSIFILWCTAHVNVIEGHSFFLSLMYILFLTFESINWEYGSVWGNDSSLVALDISLEMARIACCSDFSLSFSIIIIICFTFTLSHKYVASPIAFRAWTQTIFHVFSYLKIERNTTWINVLTLPFLLAAYYQADIFTSPFSHPHHISHLHLPPKPHDWPKMPFGELWLAV